MGRESFLNYNLARRHLSHATYHFESIYSFGYPSWGKWYFWLLRYLYMAQWLQIQSCYYWWLWNEKIWALENYNNKPDGVWVMKLTFSNYIVRNTHTLDINSVLFRKLWIIGWMQSCNTNECFLEAIKWHYHYLSPHTSV